MRSVPYCERWALSIATIMLLCCGIQPGLISSAPTAPTGTLVRRMVGEIDKAAELKPLRNIASSFSISSEENITVLNFEKYMTTVPREEQVPFRDWLNQQAQKNGFEIKEDGLYLESDITKYLEAWRDSRKKRLRASSEFYKIPVFKDSYLHGMSLYLPQFMDYFLPPKPELREAFENLLHNGYKLPNYRSGADFLAQYQAFAMEYTKDKGFMAEVPFISEYLPDNQRLRTAFLAHLQRYFAEGQNDFDPLTEAPVSSLMGAYLVWVMEFDVPNLEVPETQAYLRSRLWRAERINENREAYQRYYRPPYHMWKPDGQIETTFERFFRTGLGDPKLQYAFSKTIPNIRKTWTTPTEPRLFPGEIHAAYREFARRRREANIFRKIYYWFSDLTHRIKDSWKKMSFLDKLDTASDIVLIDAILSRRR
ncbi:hypothetical protein CROQUDRAFT_108669 [Cronartium quercuum f. sp. fusiforme G11]|uniref:Uncharacterized protein n=1 Tax=Cronartium quercuum f. sp. fusiforme G11 TaxID=708437 RepID=A0A9P6NCG4_9BASI|nr:hypothetical protein CROQUDRAFT_108669 [Cronartium quercuum f. sp. fusiforme G11]